MKTLSMSLHDVLSPVTKANFKKWHNDGNLLLLDAGIGNLDIILSRLNDTSVDYKAQGKQVTTATVDGNHNKVFMFSNGVEEFIIVVSELSNSDRRHLTIYVVGELI